MFYHFVVYYMHKYRVYIFILVISDVISDITKNMFFVYFSFALKFF